MFTLEFSAESVGDYGIFARERIKEILWLFDKVKGCGCRRGVVVCVMTAEAFKLKEMKIGGGNIWFYGRGNIKNSWQ